MIGWCFYPLKLSFLTLPILHFPSKNLVIREDQDTLPMHLSLPKTTLISDSIFEDNETFPMKGIVLELTLIFELSILKYTLLSEPLFKLAFELEVKAVLSAIPAELSLLEVATVIRCIVFYGESMAVGLIMLELAHKDLLFKIILPVALLLSLAIHLPSEYGFSGIVDL